MAYTYDEFGTPVWIDDEEERRRQELLAAQQAAIPVVEQPAPAAEMTPPSVQPVAVAPIAVARQPAVQAVPSIAPVAPQVVDQSAYTAQMESGNRPDIGYHNPQRSTAYGTYGITAPAYQDVQRANPQFAGRDITSLTPEEQKAAYNTYTNLNAQALQRLGIEPTEANQRLAHFLGARGAADYINHGYISPRAAAANGGEERVRQIAEQRLAGGNAPASGAAEPYAGAGRGIAGMPQAMPAAGVQVATGQGVKGTPTSTEQSVAQFSAIADDPEKLLQFRKDTSHPEWLRQWAGAEASAQLSRDINAATAKQQVEQLTAAAGQGDRQAANTIAKELQSQGGSWVKMLLLSYISPELAGEEAIKLGFGNKWQTTTDENGKPALIQVNARGLPLKGYTADGKEIPANQLVAYAGGKRNLDIVGGTYVNDTTGEVGRVVTDKNTGKSYIQTDTGVKPMTGFRPQSSTGTLADMRTRALQDLNIKLQGKGVEEAMQILRPYNQQLAQNGFAPIQPAEVGISVPQVGVGQIPQAPSAGVAAPVAPQQVAPSAGVTAPAAGQPVTRPVTPAAGIGLGGRPTMTELEASKTKAKEEAEVVGKDIGTIRANQGKSEANADYLITKVNELITHPGFETSVGRKGLSYGFGLSKEPLLEGTDASDWQARFKEVGGQSFLQAIENLRGLGALSNQEGESATKAIQRMNTSQSEREFKAAAEDFNEIIQRGIDRNRSKLGQKPKYGTKSESETAEIKRAQAETTKLQKLTTEDRQAVEWARANPNDPRATEIKRRLGL